MESKKFLLVLFGEQPQLLQSVISWPRGSLYQGDLVWEKKSSKVALGVVCWWVKFKVAVLQYLIAKYCLITCHGVWLMNVNNHNHFLVVYLKITWCLYIYIYIFIQYTSCFAYYLEVVFQQRWDFLSERSWRSPWFTDVLGHSRLATPATEPGKTKKTTDLKKKTSSHTPSHQNVTTRWFKVTFSSPNWRSPTTISKESRFHHPKKVTTNCQVNDMILIF